MNEYSIEELQDLIKQAKKEGATHISFQRYSRTMFGKYSDWDWRFFWWTPIYNW